MAFTMLLSEDGEPSPAIICDRCGRLVGRDGRVFWGRQYVDADDDPQPFTTVTRSPLGRAWWQPCWWRRSRSRP